MKKFQGIVAIVLVMAMLALVGCDFSITTDESTETSAQGEMPSGTTEQGKTPSGTTEQVLVDNDVVKVTFVEIYEEPSLPGNCFLRVKVENKSDKTVTVSLTDTYVNDTAQMMGSGVPMTLAPGKNSQAPFFFGYTNLGISTKDEITKIEFKVWLLDEDFDTVIKTDSLVVEFNK